MADANMQNFAERLTRINKHHARLSQGHVTTVNNDGLIVVKPRRNTFRFPWRSLMYTAALLLVFKSVVFMSLGQEAYDARVDKLRDGTVVEQMGAFIMQAEPATIGISGIFASLVE